jgi:hypothetical protein
MVQFKAKSTELTSVNECFFRLNWTLQQQGESLLLIVA